MKYLYLKNCQSKSIPSLNKYFYAHAGIQELNNIFLPWPFLFYNLYSWIVDSNFFSLISIIDFFANSQKGDKRNFSACKHAAKSNQVSILSGPCMKHGWVSYYIQSVLKRNGPIRNTREY